MRLYLALLAVLLVAGCTKVYGPQRLDFIGTTRYTSSNRTGLGAADTLATRLFAENTDAKGAKLGRLVITVRYQPRRNPFLYPTPVSALSRDSIDKSAENFVFLDSTLVDQSGGYPDNFLLTTTYGVRTTTGSERWIYELHNTDGDLTASRAVQLSMRRLDSLYSYQDYTLRLVIPAVGVPAAVRAKSTRRYLNLLAGLALPAYTVLKAGAPNPPQAAAQQLIDLIVQPDGRTIVAPDMANLNAARWPLANRRATRIYRTGLDATAFASRVTDAGIMAIYNTAASSATGTGKSTGAVSASEVYAFRTVEGTTAAPSYRYGLLLVVSIPSATSTSVTAGLQLQVRMAKL